MWLTFNFEYLWDITQLLFPTFSKSFSCDLLSILSIFEILHSREQTGDKNIFVVTYFQFWVSLRYYTAISNRTCCWKQLWLTFNFEYLWDITQPYMFVSYGTRSCDLLSILSIFEILHSSQINNLWQKSVVTYFQFWVSLRYYTAFR